DSDNPSAPPTEGDVAIISPSVEPGSRPTLPDSNSTAADAAQRLRRLVVLGDSPSPPEPQTEFVTSLAEACERAAEIGLTELELRYTGLQEEQPLELSHARLTVRAAPGFRPGIVFGPASSSTDRQMIRLIGGSSAHVAFEGVDLRLELAADLLADGFSLLAMGT